MDVQIIQHLEAVQAAALLDDVAHGVPLQNKNNSLSSIRSDLLEAMNTF